MNLIVAVDKNWGIGRQDRLLFRISEDMKRFRALTLGKTVVLGRRTLQTFPGGRPLDNRTNIILTQNPEYNADSAIICHSLSSLGALIRDLESDDVLVIGGASVYNQLLPYCREAFVTKIDGDVEADCFFPNLDELDGWELISCESRYADQAWQNGSEQPVSLAYAFCTYRQADPRELPHD